MSEFKPQDFSRFLIREFLKKNGFDKTYDQFMIEDDRPKITMTKNELMRLLGIETLMKRNTKTKQFETMMDIICDFLIAQRDASGGVDLPQTMSETTTTSSSSGSKAIIMESGPKRVGSVLQKKAPAAIPQGSKTQANWFGGSGKPSESLDEQEEVEAAPVQPKKKEHAKVAEPVDDWDLEDESSSGYIKVPTRGKAQATPMQAFGMRPATAVPSQKQTEQVSDGWIAGGNQQVKNNNVFSQQNQGALPIPKKRVIPKQAGKQEEIDELDDLMGFGSSDSQAQNMKGGKQDVMRDTLGFLKKSEEEKKRKEEEKKTALSKKDAAYKHLSDVKHNLGGYESDSSYNYSVGQQLPASIRTQLQQKMKVEVVSQTESAEIKKLLFKSAGANFHDSWHQGFFFHDKIKYGIFQKEGGPCGILATVQAFFLKHLLFMTQTKLTDVSREQRENLIAAAISDILINSQSETGSNKIVLVIPAPQQNPKSPIQAHQCQKLTITFTEDSGVFNAVKDNISYFTQAEGHGVVLLVYSVILTRGITRILGDMDMRENSLLTEHGYASQELINIILVGKATSNVFDGDKDMGDNFIIKGIHKQSEIGFLTLFEAYGYFQVGQYLKSPKLPIWVVCSESHYSVIFSPDITSAKKKQPVFDLIYYDELAKQEEDIILTVSLGQYKGSIDLQKTTEMIPPIDAVIRTKWDMGLVSWNGRQPIL